MKSKVHLVFGITLAILVAFTTKTFAQEAPLTAAVDPVYLEELSQNLSYKKRERLLVCGIAWVPTAVLYTAEAIPVVAFAKVTKIPALLKLLRVGQETIVVSGIVKATLAFIEPIIRISDAKKERDQLTYDPENDYFDDSYGLDEFVINTGLGGLSVIADMVLEQSFKPSALHYTRANFELSGVVKRFFMEDMTDCQEIKDSIRQMTLELSAGN